MTNIQTDTSYSRMHTCL